MLTKLATPVGVSVGEHERGEAAHGVPDQVVALDPLGVKHFGGDRHQERYRQR